MIRDTGVSFITPSENLGMNEIGLCNTGKIAEILQFNIMIKLDMSELSDMGLTVMVCCLQI